MRHVARRAAQAGVHAGEIDRNIGVIDRHRREESVDQFEAVERHFVIGTRAGLLDVPDRPYAADVVRDPCRRMVEGHRATTVFADLDSDLEHALLALRPCHRDVVCGPWLVGRRGTTRAASSRGDLFPQSVIRREHAVVAREIDSRRRHPCRQSGHDKSAGWPICAAAGCPAHRAGQRSRQTPTLIHIRPSHGQLLPLAHF